MTLSLRAKMARQAEQMCRRCQTIPYRYLSTQIRDHPVVFSCLFDFCQYFHIVFQFHLEHRVERQPVNDSTRGSNDSHHMFCATT